MKISSLVFWNASVYTDASTDPFLATSTSMSSSHVPGRVIYARVSWLILGMSPMSTSKESFPGLTDRLLHDDKEIAESPLLAAGESRYSDLSDNSLKRSTRTISWAAHCSLSDRVATTNL